MPAGVHGGVSDMRSINEIKAEFEAEAEIAAVTGKQAKAKRLRAELVNALAKDISIKRLEEICNAERDGRLVIIPEGATA